MGVPGIGPPANWLADSGKTQSVNLDLMRRIDRIFILGLGTPTYRALPYIHKPGYQAILKEADNWLHDLKSKALSPHTHDSDLG